MIKFMKLLKLFLILSLAISFAEDTNSSAKKNKKTLVLQDIAKMLTIVKGETKKSSK